MVKAWDSDGHVFESEKTFADPYWDQSLRGRRPMVVETDALGNLSYMIDSLSMPRLTTGRDGPGVAIAYPLSKNGVESPRWMEEVASAREMGHTETLASAELHTAAARVEQLDREDVSVQVNYPTLFLTWPIAHDPQLGAACARSYNNWIADISSQAPDRLKWVTVIDPADPKEAAREIERTKGMGSVGVMVLGTVGNRWITEPNFEPIWATAAECDLSVAVHIGYNCPAIDNMCTTGQDENVIGFVFPLLLGFWAVMRSGVLDRYPRLRVGFLENGCRWLDFMTKRITENGFFKQREVTLLGAKKIQAALSADQVGGSGLGRPPSFKTELLPEEYIQRGQVFVNAEVDEAQVRFVVEEYGDDFLLFASDIPHAHRIVRPIDKLMARTDLSDDTKRKILVDNNARFYGLPVPQLVDVKAAASAD